MEHAVKTKRILPSLAVAAIFALSTLFCSCVIPIINFIDEASYDADKCKIEADIKTTKDSSSIKITITPKDKKVYAYTLFEVKNGITTQIDCIAVDSAYSILDDGTFKLNTLPYATFTVKNKGSGTFYIACETDNKSYKSGDDISIYTKTLFTPLFTVY